MGSPASCINSVSKPSASRTCRTRLINTAVFPSFLALPLNATTFTRIAPTHYLEIENKKVTKSKLKQHFTPSFKAYIREGIDASHRLEKQ
jgi:hypothetical protein